MGIITGIIIIMIIVIAVMASLLLSDSTSEEQGELEFGDIYHEPLNPDTDDIVYFYIEIINCPSSYDIVYKIEAYNGSTLKSYGAGDLSWGKVSKNMYQHIEHLTDTGYDTGYEVRFWVEIYDVDWDSEANQTPILTSDVDSFVIS